MKNRRTRGNLLQVKGVPGKLQVKEVPFILSSLNQGDSFVLDIGRKIFIWHGKQSNVHERMAAKMLAENMISTRNLTTESDMCTVCSGVDGMKEQILLELLPDVEKRFFGLMRVNSRIRSAKEGGRDERQREVHVGLYRLRLSSSGKHFKFRTCKALERENSYKKGSAFSSLKKLLNYSEKERKSPIQRILSVRSSAFSSDGEETKASCYSSASDASDTSSVVNINDIVDEQPYSKVDAPETSFSMQWFHRKDCLVLDTGLMMYIWLGKSCKNRLKRRCKTARNLLDSGNKLEVEVMKAFNRKFKKSVSLPWKVIFQDLEPEEFLRFFQDVPQF